MPFWKCFDRPPYLVSSHLLEPQIWNEWSKLWKKLLVNFLQLHVVQIFFFSFVSLLYFCPKFVLNDENDRDFLERYWVKTKTGSFEGQDKANKSVKGQPTAL